MLIGSTQIGALNYSRDSHPNVLACRQDNRVKVRIMSNNSCGCGCAAAASKAAAEQKSLILEALFEVLFRVIKTAAGAPRSRPRPVHGAVA